MTTEKKILGSHPSKLNKTSNPKSTKEQKVLFYFYFLFIFSIFIFYLYFLFLFSIFFYFSWMSKRRKIFSLTTAKVVALTHYVICGCVVKLLKTGLVCFTQLFKKINSLPNALAKWSLTIATMTNKRYQIRTYLNDPKWRPR